MLARKLLSYFTGKESPPCMPCCVAPTTPPGECACALMIPPFGSPYPDYATAAAELANPIIVADCITYLSDGTGLVTALSAVDSGSDVVVSATFSAPVVVFGDSWLSITLSSGDTLSIAYTGGTDISVTIYDCNGNEIETVNSSSSPASISAVPADGVYYLKVAVTDPDEGAFTDASYTVTPSAVYVVNPVIALWDDSGTTRQLEACPKMLLPPLTESSGIWYADETAAQDAIDNLTSNCVGYADAIDGATGCVLVASGTTSLSFALTRSTPDDFLSMQAWGSVNAEAGETLSSAWNTAWSIGSTKLVSVGFAIFDDSGNLVEDLSDSSSLTAPNGTDSGTITSSALPYTGRYIVAVSLTLLSGIPAFVDDVELDAVVSSSGTLSVNPIQALYDVGVDCPARLDCT